MTKSFMSFPEYDFSNLFLLVAKLNFVRQLTALSLNMSACNSISNPSLETSIAFSMRDAKGDKAPGKKTSYIKALVYL